MEAQDVIEKHYRENYNRLVKRVTRWAGGRENAEDAVQTAYTYALSYFGSYDPAKSFDNWFNKILSNSLKEIHRANSKHAYEEIREEDLEAHHDQSYFKHLKKEIAKEADRFEDERKEVILLYFLHGYTPKDIRRVTTRTPRQITEDLYQFRERVRGKYGKLDANSSSRY